MVGLYLVSKARITIIARVVVYDGYFCVVHVHIAHAFSRKRVVVIYAHSKVIRRVVNVRYVAFIFVV